MGNQATKGPHTRAMESIAGAFATGDGDTSTTISLSGTAAAATGLRPNAVYRLWADVNCHVRFADSGDADTGDMPLTAELPEWFVLQDVTRISAIQMTSAGTLWITRMG